MHLGVLEFFLNHVVISHEYSKIISVNNAVMLGEIIYQWSYDLGPLHMSPVDRAGSVTEMKLVSVHMVTFSPLSEMKNLKSGDATIQA